MDAQDISGHVVTSRRSCDWTQRHLREVMLLKNGYR